MVSEYYLGELRHDQGNPPQIAGLGEKIPQMLFFSHFKPVVK